MTGFTSFLNCQHATSLIPRVDGKRARIQRKEKLARTMMQVAKCADQGEDWREQWIVTAMEYFHGKRVSNKALRKQSIKALWGRRTSDDEWYELLAIDGIKA